MIDLVLNDDLSVIVVLDIFVIGLMFIAPDGGILFVWVGGVTGDMVRSGACCKEGRHKEGHDKL